jgi:hypothetical protein
VPEDGRTPNGLSGQTIDLLLQNSEENAHRLSGGMNPTTLSQYGYHVWIFNAE